CRRGGQAGGEGAEEEVGLVLQNHAAIKLLHTLGIGFIVVAGKLDFVGLAAGLDATGSVDLVAPEFEAAVLLDGVHIQGSGPGDCESEGNGLLGKGGSDKV